MLKGAYVVLQNILACMHACTQIDSIQTSCVVLGMSTVLCDPAKAAAKCDLSLKGSPFRVCKGFAAFQQPGSFSQATAHKSNKNLRSVRKQFGVQSRRAGNNIISVAGSFRNPASDAARISPRSCSYCWVRLSHYSPQVENLRWEQSRLGTLHR